jgi:plastocyanin domain-containing protein
MTKRTLHLIGLTTVLLACKTQADASPEAKPGAPIAITADDKGYTPSSVEVKKGSPVTLVFTRTSDDTCAREVVFPEINLKKDLPLKTPVTIDVPSAEARTLTFQCGMGMFKGKVLIK